MTKDEVKTIVQEALLKAQTDVFGLDIVSVSDEPVEGYWNVVLEPSKLEPYSILDYYGLLSQIEEDLSERGDIHVILTSALNGSSEYRIGGEWIEVVERESGNFSAMPKRSHGGTRYSATFWPDGQLAMTGTVGLGSLEPPPKEWTDRFKQAVQLHLQQRQARDATA